MAKKTKLMRVPVEFDDMASRLKDKLGRKTKTEFLRVDGVRLFKNAETLTDITRSFFGPGHNNERIKPKRRKIC